jgi:hypothetical protein
MACKFQYKGKWYTREQLLSHPDFSAKTPYMEREYNLTDTGPKSYSEITLYSPATEAGVFTKFLQFKETQLREAKKKLSEIERKKKIKTLTQDEILALNKQEKETKLLIDGKEELGIKGLADEIFDLKQKADINAIGYYAHNDLERLEKLSQSTDISDLAEAQRIIDFYTLAGTFEKGLENPFFLQEDIFLADENGKLTSQYKLDQETRDKFKKWGDDARYFQNEVNLKYQEVLVNTVNSNAMVKNTYGKPFSYEEILRNEDGLKDTNWVDMWVMDITQGIFSHNGLVPQVMFSFLAQSFDKKLSWARQIEERIDKMRPSVEKELIEMGYSLRGGGIIGLRGASYSLFKEVTREGNETGGLIQRFVKEFFDAQANAINKFKNSYDNAKTYEDYTLKMKAFNKAFEELKRWKRNNVMILDINKVPELTSSTPETEAYKQSLISLLGVKGYNEQVDKQKQLLRKYEAEKQSTLDSLLVLENKSDYADLSQESKDKLASWENNHSPKVGVEDYYSVKGVFVGDRKVNNWMNYNVTFPRKFVPKITNDGNVYSFQDSGLSTGYYSKNFEIIEKNKVLSEFYDVMKEVLENVRENMPQDVQRTMAANTLPALKKSFSEILADKNHGILSTVFAAYKHIMEKIRLSFGVTEQSTFSYATVDPITGKSNYRVNDQFLRGNTKSVQERIKIEQARFLQAYNTNRPKDKKVGKIRRFSTLPLQEMDANTLLTLAEYINSDITLAEIKAGRLDKIRNVTGDNVEVGKYIRDFSIHSVVQSQSFDLAKMGKYIANMTMSYAARQEALPILEILKKHYEGIKSPKTNNTKKGMFNVLTQTNEMIGVRTNAIRQMDDWFERVVLDNYGGKHSLIHGKNIKQVTDDKGNVKTKIPFFSRKIFSNEEKRKIKDIDAIISKETDDAIKADLQNIKSQFGKERTATAAFDNLLSWIRTLRLGYNLSSASTNFLEGVTSNMILSSLGEYFDPKEIYYGYGVIKTSFVKNMSFGLVATNAAKKNRSLMDKFNVVMDSKNELQKSSVKTYASKFSWMLPHELNQRVEFINQSPIMIAMARTVKVKDKNGKEAMLWEAYNSDGHLKPEFQTEENIENWENLTGEEYLKFKQKLSKAIVLAHGNYDELRGMMIKNNSAGKALMMFKTWIPMQLYQRFAVEQDDIQSGTQGFKGRYFSYGAATAGLHGAIAGLAMFGPLGGLVGWGVGAIGGGIAGTDSGVGMLKETLEATKSLAKKMFGMPVNLLAGRQLINVGNKDFSDWVGKGSFTEQDAKNMRANMADITIQLAWLALILAVKGMFWDDDDKPKDPDRVTHNILINRLMSLSSQGSMYINPVALFKSVVQQNAVWQYLKDVGATIDAANEAIHGRDIVQSGMNAGESNLANKGAKIVLPGLFKDKMLGFGTQAERVFEESPFHPYFKSEAKVEQESNKRERAEYRLQLKENYNIEDFEDEKEMKKEIERLVDERYPTPSKLEKLGVTREEYEELQEEKE